MDKREEREGMVDAKAYCKKRCGQSLGTAEVEGTGRKGQELRLEGQLKTSSHSEFGIYQFCPE